MKFLLIAAAALCLAAAPVIATAGAVKAPACCGCCTKGKCACAKCACCDCSQCPGCAKK